MMFPEIVNIEDIPILEDQLTPQPPGKTYLFDFEKGDFVRKDGKLVKVEGVEALKVWIEKNIRTEIDKYKVYEGSVYGVGIWELVGQNLPQPFVESEIERELIESLSLHPEIESLTDFEFVREKSRLIIKFTVNVTNGTSFNQEVSMIG
jgi:hypothetical protein